MVFNLTISLLLHLDSYKRLNDKQIDIKERLELAQMIWSSNKYDFLNKEQIILEWLIGLVTNKRKYFTLK